MGSTTIAKIFSLLIDDKAYPTIHGIGVEPRRKNDSCFGEELGIPRRRVQGFKLWGHLHSHCLYHISG